MNGDQSRKVTEIRTAIQNGSLTRAEIVERLSAAIEAELSKTDSPADMQLVRTCQDFLWELQMGGDEAYVSNIDANRKAVEEKMKLYDKRRTIQRGSMRIAAIAAAISILAIVGDGLLNRGWLKSYSSGDEQQYVIQGQAVDPGLVPDGSAGNKTEPSDLTTSNLQEAIAFLGFQPDMPAWLPEGWRASIYYIAKSVDSKRLVISYESTNKQQGSLTYDASYFIDGENAYATFEQNAMGNTLNLTGQTIYYSYNVDKLICIWQNNLTIYSLTGSLELEEALEIISSIGGKN